MPPASIDNIFGAPAPAAGGTPTPPSTGPSIDNIFGGVAKAAPPVAPALSVANTPPPPDTSSLFSKFTGFLGNTAGKVSKAISDATTAPENLGSNPTENMMRFLPSELARAIPGVADIQDNPELAQYIGPKDITAAVPTALGQTAKGMAQMPIKAVADVYDTARVLTGNNPNASFTVPGLGRVTSDVLDVTEAIKNGQNPVVAVLNSGSSSIFNVLFFADIMNRVAGPRSVKVAETQGNLPDGATVDTGPKTGRLYETPTSYNRGGAQVLPQEMLDQMKAQGVKLGDNFNPAQPVFFKTTIKGGTYTGEMYQVKPSYLSSLYESVTSAKTPTNTLPGLLGAGIRVPETALTIPEMKLAIEKAPSSAVTTLHTQTVTDSAIIKATNDAVAKNPAPIAPVTPVQPTPSATSHVVTHNALRLLGGDTIQAKTGAALLEKNIQDGVAAHGPDVTAQALVKSLGVDQKTAATLVREVLQKTPVDAQELLTEMRNKGIAQKGDAFYDKAIAEATSSGKTVNLDADSFKVASGDLSPTDHAPYAQAVQRAYTKALATNESPNVFLTVGGPGTGKTEVLGHALANEGGIMFQGTGANYNRTVANFKEAVTAGKTPVFVTNIVTPAEAWKFAQGRTAKGGHTTDVEYFIKRSNQAIETLKKLIAEGYPVRMRNHGEYVKNPQEQLAILKDLKYDISHVQDTSSTSSTDGKNLLQSGSNKKVERGTRSVEKGGGLTQKERVTEAVKEKPLSIKEVAEQTKILEPNVRRILGVGTKEGTFERVSEGVYVLKTAAGNYAYVEMGDAETSLARMAEEGKKFDSVILDPAYFSRALIGGNRGLKAGKSGGGWDGFIQAPEFAKVMKSVAVVVKNDDTHVYLMLSGARTAQVDMDKYVKGAIDAGFKAVGEGGYKKMNKNGTPAGFPYPAGYADLPSERLILLTKSGNPRNVIQQIPMYHGTLADFEKFDMNMAGKNTEWDNAKFGLFFIDDPARAQTFADENRAAGDTRTVKVKKVYLDIKNPIDLTHQGIFTKEEQAPVIVELIQGKPGMNPKKALKYINDNIGLGEIGDLHDALYSDIANKKIMQDAGYDGIISEFGQDDAGKVIREYVAFDASQINNSPTPNLDFRFVRPSVTKSYQTEKPAELMKALIEQSTLKGETILDPFAGSGVTGAEAIKAGRNAHLIEKQESTVENFTKPRIEAAAKEEPITKLEQATRELEAKGKELDKKLAAREGIKKITDKVTSGELTLEKANEELSKYGVKLGDIQDPLNPKQRAKMNGLAQKAHEEFLKNGEIKTLNLVSEDAKKDTLLKINEEEVKRPDVLISKSGFKNLVATLPDQQGDFKVVSNPEGQLRMELDTPHGHMSLRPSALGLVESQLKEGDVIHVDADNLKPKGTSYRVVNKDNKVEASGGGAASAVRMVKPNFSSEMNRGFISADPVIEAADKMSKFIEETGKKIEVSENLADDLYKLETNNKRDLEIAIQMLHSVDFSPADAEAIYHYEEDKTLPLTDKQKELYDTVIKPLAEKSSEIFSRLQNEGLPMNNEDYTPRFVQGKKSAVERIARALIDGVKNVSAGQGSMLSKTTGAMKKRTMKALVDENGNRTVVSIKGGIVTSIQGKVATVMGTTARRVAPKVKEFFDPEVRGKLETLAKELGITHERHATGKTLGLGGKRAGVSFQGESLIKTRMSPDSVLAHEIGHQIDHKYGMQQFMSEERYDKEHRLTLAKEMRALADERFAGEDTKPGFKAYVRQGSEKMAVMFEAYISNKQLFKDVAPHLYDDFRQFLRDHKELAPFLDIKGSVTLDSTVHGGNLLAGRSGSTFVSNTGKAYRIEEATTKEIEKETSVQYHKNVLVNRTLQYLKLRQIDRANEFIEAFKNDPNFSEIAVKSGEEAPDNFKSTRLPQFRGYLLEPRLAEIFNRLADKMDSPDGMYAAMGTLNRVLRNAIFFNPLIHVPNITVHWAVNRGLSKFVLPSGYIRGAKAFARAFDAVVHHTDDYLVALEHGAPLLSSDASNKKLAEVLLDKMATDLQADPQRHALIAKALGYANPVNLVKAIYNFSSMVTWGVNDLLTMQAVYEDMATHGWSLDRAIEETGKHIPNYRVPERIFDKPLTIATGEKVGGMLSTTAGSAMKNPVVSMFGAYHYGALRSYGEMMKTLMSGEGAGGKEGWKNRAGAADKIAMMGLLGLVLYPYLLDKIARWLTGNKNAKFRRAGSLTFPENISMLLSGEKDAGQVFQSVVTPAPATKMIAELVPNIDFWSGNKIYGIGGEGFWNFMADQLAPIQQARQVTSGNKSTISFFASLGGISSPTSTGSEKILSMMIYDEKPKLMKDMKARIAAGDIQGAKDIGHEFNVRLSETIKESLLENGKSGSDAQVALVLNKNGIRMPGAVAMQNYTANKGKSFIAKLSADGKPTVKVGVPIENDSIIHAVMVYASAIVTDPATAFADIFKGQVIRKVENGTVIVRRMTLQESSAVKEAGGGNNPSMKLDHTIPLELGGTNEQNNLNLVPTATWASYTPVENYLGEAIRAGTIDTATAQKLIVNFKTGIMTFDDVKNAIAK